jgi:hypothetical protein
MKLGVALPIAATGLRASGVNDLALAESYRSAERLFHNLLEVEKPNAAKLIKTSIMELGSGIWVAPSEIVKPNSPGGPFGSPDRATAKLLLSASMSAFAVPAANVFKANKKLPFAPIGIGSVSRRS